MTLTDNGKIYIATHFGIGNCFAGSGLSWVAVDVNDVTASESGGTAQIVARLLTPNVYKEIRITAPSTQAGTYTNAQLIAANDGQNITGPGDGTDYDFIKYNDGNPDPEPKYCIGGCVPVWTCEIPLNGYQYDGCGNRELKSECDPVIPSDSERVGEYVFVGPQEGDPTIILDLSNLEMSQDPRDFHFEMNNIVITSTSPIDFYIALEVRLFSGAHALCPTSGAVFTGMDRVSTTRIPRIKLLNPGEIDDINADFYQPESIRGVHTVCLLVHGAWDRDVLKAEILPIIG